MGELRAQSDHSVLIKILLGTFAERVFAPTGEHDRRTQMRHALRLCNAAALRLPAAAHLLPAASGATRSHSAAAYVQNNARNFADITVEFRAAAPGSLPDPFALVQPQLRLH